MIYLIYGEDTKRSLALLGEFEKRFRREVPLLWHLVDFGDNQSAEKIEDILGVQLFSDKSYLILKQASCLFDERKELLENMFSRWCENNSIIVFFEYGTPKKDKFFEKLKKAATKKQEFTAMSQKEASLWLENLLKKREAPVSESVKRMLIERFSDDAWRLESELEKHLAGAEIKTTGKGTSDKELFLIGDLWSQKERERAILASEKLKRSGFGADEILRTLLWHIKTLLFVAAKRTKGIHPFVVQKMSGHMRTRKKNEIESAYECLLIIDVTSKQGRGDIEHGLLHFLLTH